MKAVRKIKASATGTITMNKSSLLLVSVGLALAGCTMAPKYERPAAPVAKSFPNSSASTNAAAIPAAEIGWHELFNDPRLLQLIELSLTNNRDLRVTVLNVELSRSQYRIARSALLPTVNANASGIRQRVPADINGTGQAATTTSYNVNVGTLSYELDLFGRVRSLKNQALNQYFATDQGRRSAQIALVSEVANQYLQERQLDEQLAVARQTLHAVQDSYDLNKHSFEGGVISELDLRTSEAQVQTALANVAALSQDRAQAENALVLLVGGPLPASLPPPQPLGAQRLLADLPEGLPADLLQRRPDILQAEFQLKAANANIGAARAAFFPRVLLTGAVGSQSLKVEDLFTGPQQAWSFAPQISLPLFTGGLNKANLDVARVSKRIEVANYERTIQVAFREVADALIARRMLEEQIVARTGLVAAEQKRYDLANMRYRNGVDSYLNVLSAQQDLYGAQQNLIQIQSSRLANLITLYRALGGGWQEHTQPRKQLAASGTGSSPVR
jgi:outer membrane protein, multidrug efflux system